MKSLITPEVSAVLTPALIAVLFAVAGCIGAWLKMKTRQWEAMTIQARKFAEESRNISQETRELVQQNAERVISIELQGNGMRHELENIAKVAAFTAGKIRGRLEKTGMLNADELEEMEKEFNESLRQKHK